MGPRDRPRPLPDGAACTACGAPVPISAIRILAQRDDLAFVQLPCPGCGSTALAILLAGSTADGPPTLDVAADGPASFRTRHGSMPPITTAEVEAIRRDLAAWDGDLVGWLRAIDDRRRGSALDR
jgi:hypothetical protein